jgi:alpha-1,6-mannosyltransferase
VIALGSVLVVVLAADRPSVLSPTSHTDYFPRWMAGPLGGLWPGLTRSTTALKYLFSGAIVAMYAAYLVALAHVPRMRARWAIGAIVTVHAIFLLAPPLALTDVFNYINYGRMEVVHQLNPYTTIPIAEPHGDPSFELSNWHQLLSPYGPLFTVLTFALVPLGVAGSFWAIKGVLAAASLATIWLVWRCARLLGLDPVGAIALVGLNPIVLVWGLGGEHNDSLMLLFIMLAFYLLLASKRARAPARDAVDGIARVARARSPWSRLRELPGTLGAFEIAAGAALVTAAAIKASGAVLIPVVLAGLLKTPKRLTSALLGVVLGLALAGGVSLIAFGLHFPDLSTQSWLVTNVSVPNLLGLALGLGGESEGLRSALSAGLAAAVLLCCLFAWRGREGVLGLDLRRARGRRHPVPIAAAAPGRATARELTGAQPANAGVDRSIVASGWATVALLVTLSWVLPWYVLWLLPLAALARSDRLRATALVLGVYLIVAWLPASGSLWNAIGFHPERTALGHLHQRYVRQLLH